MNNTEHSQPTKRALSLDDLVNHDDTDKIKLQKTENQPSQPDAQPEQNVSPRLPPVPAPQETNNATSNARLPLTTAPSPPPPAVAVEKSNVSSDSSMGPDDETDTDDDIAGNGEINFDSPMAFDYDKQDRNSPVKPALPAKRKEKLKKPKKEEPEEEEEEVKKDTTPTAAVNHIFEEKASLESKKNYIKKDLEVLNEIASNAKPNKYRNAPIWAQKWKPTIKALQNIDTKDFKIDSSFLNIIPDDDLTKSVQDWVYATVFSIAPDLRPFIELEMKFGVIIDAKGPDRVSPPISSQAVFTELDAHMTPNVDEVLFKELNKYVRGISEQTENSGKFSIIESHMRDSVYRVGLSTQRPRFLRMSTDVKTGRVGQFIEKRHVAQLLLFSPKDSYDVKISINLELPVPENDPPEKYKSQTPVSERTKERVSYIHNDSCTRIDITKVHNHNQGIKGRDVEITHEIELEINTPALLSAFDNITQDSKQYASVIRTFLNNGTIIRRKLTSLSYEIFEGQKKV